MKRNMKEKGMSVKSLAREVNILMNSVTKYLKSEGKGKRKRDGVSKLDQYRDLIHTLIDEHNLFSCQDTYEY